MLMQEQNSGRHSRNCARGSRITRFNTTNNNIRESHESDEFGDIFATFVRSDEMSRSVTSERLIWRVSLFLVRTPPLHAHKEVILLQNIHVFCYACWVLTNVVLFNHNW